MKDEVAMPQDGGPHFVSLYLSKTFKMTPSLITEQHLYMT